ncbi:c-type cytochrome [Planktotalea sp.]|uniref:c-type cytochrome n=1 Tax=Planktotalea sp. TaxID=2029877 RepID=UPI00329A4A05
MYSRASAVLFIALCCAGPASANSIGTEHEAPYEVCALCHSLDGNSRMAKFPKLAGQPAPYIEKQLYDFLEGRRTNGGGQMAAIVTEISTEDFAEVAAWFASQTAPAPNDQGDVGAGEAAFRQLGCLSCHANGQLEDGTPHLTAQHKIYLKKQMTDFRDGRRDNDLGAIMRSAMTGISDAQIEDLASYLSATQRGTP